MCGTFDTKTDGIQKWIDQDNIDIAFDENPTSLNPFNPLFISTSS
jgi:hypothetical protein